MQAQLVAQHLATEPVNAIYSSDLLRSMETAHFIALAHGLKVIPCQELREINYGSWEGKTTDELKRLFPEEYKMREANPIEFAPYNGENRRQLYHRVIKKVVEIASSHNSNHDGDSIVIVTHSGPCAAVVGYALGINISEFQQNPFTRVFHFDNCSISIIDFQADGKMFLCLYNSTSHLRKMGKEFGKEI
jgi:broad specificity phosphatase PhoE